MNFTSTQPLVTNSPTALVQKLWNYCNILRDDGLSYSDYLEQLTFLLFLKMADEQRRRRQQIRSTRMLPKQLSPRRHGDDFQ
jgi:type I restriction enzyme M protein